VKPSSIAHPWSVALVAAALSSFVELSAFAQDGPAQPPGEPTNPSSAPSPEPSAPSPDAPPATLPAPTSTETDSSPGVTPAQPSAGLAQLESQKSAAPAPAHADEEIEEPDDGKLRHHQDHWFGFVGMRVGKITSEGFDPFADSDELGQFSLGFGRTIMTAGNFSIAGLFIWDIGGRSSTARGADTDLTVHRLTLGGEGRYHFIRQLFVFGRVAPGAIHSIAKVSDPSVDVDSRAARKWSFATDLSAGATLELSGWSGHSRKRTVNAWITFDGGYGFATETELSLTADGAQGPERSEPVDLGPLALRGPFMRAAVVVTY